MPKLYEYFGIIVLFHSNEQMPVHVHGIRELNFEPFLRGAAHPEIRAYLDTGKFGQFTLKDGELFWGDYELCFPIADLYDGRI